MKRFALAAAVAAAVVLAAGQAWAAASAPAPVDGGFKFTFSSPGATSINLAGEFNGWDPGAIAMADDDGDGVWEVVIDLDRGRTYQYKFVVNGGERWEPDPLNPERTDDGYGGYNSVLSITEDGQVALGALEGGKPVVHEPIVDSHPSLEYPLNVAIVWHQHQPKYLKDLETGEYLEPWVRLHAIKDYYDMVAVLDEFPAIRFTVNLTPVLLTQLQDVIGGYERGGGTDRYLRMTLTDPAGMTTEDKVFLLTHFFNANWDNMIHVWPRYRELKDKKLGDSRALLERSAAAFTDQDWRDLQAWFNLAWFDPDFQERDVTLPDGTVVTVRHLIAKERGFTEADKKEIVATQIAIMRNVVAIHKRLQDEGRIEVTTTPYYHPILPLLVDTGIARKASPGIALPATPFRYPEDAKQHLTMAVAQYEGLFEREPAGMWPAEGAVSQEIVGMVRDAGFSWMASDDQVLESSLGSALTPKQRYSMHWAADGPKKVAMIFRDHRLSDDVGFNYSRMDGVEAANSMIRSLYAIGTKLGADGPNAVVPIILDGENAWEWFRHDGKEFFRSWYDQMSRAGWIRTVTVSEYLAEHPPASTIPTLWAGSWISRDLTTWIGEPEENTAWEYLAKTREAVAASMAAGGGLGAARAYGEILAAEGSDWFWWYGNDQTSPNEGAFDEVFRGTLSNVYTMLGEKPAPFLRVPVLASAKAAYEATVASHVAAAGAEGGAMAKGEGSAGTGAADEPTEIEFSHSAPGATSVHLAGDFNGWSTSAEPMSDPDGDGVWTAKIKLAPGSYQYKFVIDGGARWEPDAANPESVPDPYGGKNSVITVE
jgi:alpha-amylase/alpha-mannosidase (GH57 family)